MNPFRKAKLKSRKLTDPEAASSLMVTAGLREELRRDLALPSGAQLPAEIEAALDSKLAAMEERLNNSMLAALQGVARYTRGNQAMAECAGMEATGENTLIDAHLSDPDEADYSGDVFAAGQGLLAQPKLTKTEYRQLMSNTRAPAARLLGRRPGDSED